MTTDGEDHSGGGALNSSRWGMVSCSVWCSPSNLGCTGGGSGGFGAKLYVGDILLIPRIIHYKYIPSVDDMVQDLQYINMTTSLII